MKRIFENYAMQYAIPLAEWFGVGRLKPPGTLASLSILPILWLLHILGGQSSVIVFTCLVSAVGLIVVPFYQRWSKSHDSPRIVIDEIAGQSLTICFLPPDILGYAVGFVLFRICDIGKPYPIYIVDQNMRNSFAVMFDDLLAGLFAGVLGFWLLPVFKTMVF